MCEPFPKLRCSSHKVLEPRWTCCSWFAGNLRMVGSGAGRRGATPSLEQRFLHGKHGEGSFLAGTLLCQGCVCRPQRRTVGVLDQIPAHRQRWTPNVHEAIRSTLVNTEIADLPKAVRAHLGLSASAHTALCTPGIPPSRGDLADRTGT